MIRSGAVRGPWRLACLPALALAASGLAAGQARTVPDETLLGGLTFRSIGPAITGGRVADIAAVESHPSTFYVAAALGGVWKTVNHGTTWLPVLDAASTGAMGDIAIAPSNPDLVWVGTGESNADHASWGDGVYRSTDAGRTWTHAGLRDSHHIGRIVIDPRDANVVYVAAQGRLWGPNRERGLFKTTDGGRTWNAVLFIDEDTGATDVVMDPSNPDVLIAATYQRRRSAWGFNGGGPGSGLYKTDDAGKTWRKLTAGLPSGDIGRIGLDICRNRPNVVYARVEHPEGGVFRSDDHGDTWRRVSTLNPQAMAFGQIRIDPADDKRVYLLGVQLYISDDGGATFRNDGASGVHSDHRTMWINPADPNHIIDGSDGGVYVSFDRARTWMFLDNLPIAEFYHVGVDMRTPYYVYGGLQDFGSWGAPSRTRNLHGILNDDWFMIAGADGFFTFGDPTDPTIVYTATQQGRLLRYDPRTGAHKAIQPETLDEAEAPLRWTTNAPFLLSPHDPATIYAGANRILRSTDRGHSWTPISPDLSTQTNRDELSLMGVKSTDITLSRHVGIESYGAVTALAESPKTRGLLYAGTDDGNLQVTRDTGRTWTNVIAAVVGVPKQTWVSSLSTSWAEGDTAYVTFDGHRNNDFRPYVFMTHNAGVTWASIASNLPGTVALVVREDPRNPNLLYLGTEIGLFVSFDRGGRWMRLKNNLSTIPVDDLVVHPRDNDLILATRGRGVWILDDAAPLQELADRVRTTDAYLFPIRTGIQMHVNTNRVWLGHAVFAAPNPPPGTLITYYLARAADSPVMLRIQDAAGALVRELTGPGTTGVHRLNWDLRLPPPVGTRPDVTGGFWSLGSLGAFVVPGEYGVTLIVNGRVAGSRRVQVEGDPLIEVTDADRRLHFRAIVALTEMHTVIATATAALGALEQQLRTMQESLRDNSSVPATVRSAGAALQRRLAELQRTIGPPAEADGPMPPPAVAVLSLRAVNAPFQGQRAPASASAGAEPPRAAPPQRLARPEFAEFRALQRVLRNRVQMLKSEVAGSLSAPTAIQHEKLRRLIEEIARIVPQFNGLVTEGVAGFNRLLQESGLPLLPGVSVQPLVPVTYSEKP